MSKPITRNFWQFRPLLTETLPYELPVIFGNDRLYYSHCRSIDPAAKLLFDKIFRANRGHTKPYDYAIRKDSERTTQLSLVHPVMQLEFCQFYSRHESSILEYCSRSEYSLRRPAAVAAVYVQSLGDVKEAVHKTGEVHLAPEGSEPELSKLVSYFAYEKYNLLNKFYESREFIRLEKKFEVLRQIDVAKCFYSIYTHSVAWAVKSKELAKNAKAAYSFEAHFDSLMQRSNYNETNGIVVGPEVSRIFAEIILQDIDKSVQLALAAEGLWEGQHYAVRRYVDDYSIFGGTVEVVARVESVIRRELQNYKLHINESKIADFRRPFVSSITQARSDIRARLNSISALLTGKEWKAAAPVDSSQRHLMGSLVQDIRLIVKRNDVKLANLSGSLLGSLRAIVRAANKSSDKASKVSVDNWFFVTRCILECASYVTSLDLRVRTTYGLCQLLTIVRAGSKALNGKIEESVDHLISEELVAMAGRALLISKSSPGEDCVELYNLLICGAHLLGGRFIQNGQVEGILKELALQRLTYFKYIVLKYCYLRDQVGFAPMLRTLNTKVSGRFDNAHTVGFCSETFHLLCDYLGSPDVELTDKRAVFVKLFGGNPSNLALSKLSEAVGFTDWSGVWIEHTLKRRQMRPVYAVA